MIPAEILTALTGLLVGAGGVLIGWRRSGAEANAATSPAAMAGFAFETQRQMLQQLSVEVIALRADMVLLTAENAKLRTEVVQLRAELERTRQERTP